MATAKMLHFVARSFSAKSDEISNFFQSNNGKFSSSKTSRAWDSGVDIFVVLKDLDLAISRATTNLPVIHRGTRCL